MFAVLKAACLALKLLPYCPKLIAGGGASRVWSLRKLSNTLGIDMAPFGLVKRGVTVEVVKYDFPVSMVEGYSMAV